MTFEKLESRAKEASAHGARHTFVAPETVLHLLARDREAWRLKELLEKHYAQKADQELDGADDALWNAAFRVYD